VNWNTSQWLPPAKPAWLMLTASPCHVSGPSPQRCAL
jgi:hypothetical protein